jgi:hypothetical protein
MVDQFAQAMQPLCPHGRQAIMTLVEQQARVLRGFGRESLLHEGPSRPQ